MKLIKRVGRKDYCVVGWTRDEVLLKDLSPPHDIISKSRKQVYGLKKERHAR